jgi:DnaJ-class molecular chaperone
MSKPKKYTCLSCGGSGRETAYMPDVTPGSVKHVQYTRSCYGCGGTGYIELKDDPPEPPDLNDDETDFFK